MSETPPIIEVADVWRDHALASCERGGWKLTETAPCSGPINLRFYLTDQEAVARADLRSLHEERCRREEIIGQPI